MPAALSLMSHWNDQFAAIRAQFLIRARQRLQKIESLLNQLKSDSSNEEMLSQAVTNLHWLAGAGGTYGLPELSQIGSEGEAILEKYLAVKTEVITDNDMDKLL